jgi:hypothetical protein
MPLIEVILHVFHFEISGIEVNFVHSEKIKLILETFSMFQTDISGNDFNSEHLLNK